MKACFTQDDHKIVVEKKLSQIQLIIDGKVCAEEKNFFKVQNGDYDLKGKAENPDGTISDIIVRFKHGLFIDEVTLFYNDKEIDTKQII